MAVTLTCKSAFRAFFPAVKSRLDGPGLRNLLLLLEESVSRDLFFCHNCTRLHRFKSSWAPGCQYQSSLGLPCEPKVTNVGDLYIGFHHIRLVMNSHFFGPGHGLSLNRFETKFTHRCTSWETHYAARILQDQLFLRVSHRLLLNKKHHSISTSIRTAIRNDCPHHICHHITTHPPTRNPRDPYAVLPTQIPDLTPLGGKFDNYSDDVKDFDNAPGSCCICLTDFTTTVKQRKADSNSEPEMLDVAVVSYHQLGHCRSPSDWKWLTFSAPYSQYPSGFITRANHAEPYYDLGGVKKRWDMGDSKVFMDSK